MYLIRNLFEIYKPERLRNILERQLMRISRKNSETNQGLKAASINIKKGILKAAIKEGKKLDKAEQNSKRLKIVIPSPPEIKP